MEEMKLQVTELQKVKDKFITLEQKYDVSKFNFAGEVRKSKGLTQQVKTLEKDLTFENPLNDIKKILWTNIINSINDIWSSIQIIFEHIDLVKVALQEIEKTKEELGGKPEEAIRLIKFLNSRNKHQLEQLNIKDRTVTILEIKNVLTKRSLMQGLERKCQNMQEDIDEFMEKFGILKSKGLPIPLVMNDKLMFQDDYVNKLYQQAYNQASSSATKALHIGRVLYDSLENLFYIEHEVRHLFPVQPNFVKYTDEDGIYRKLTRTRILSDN